MMSFRQPYLIDDMAVIVILILWHTGYISCLDSGCSKKFEGHDAVQAAVEGRFNILGIFPEADGILVFRLYLLIFGR